MRINSLIGVVLAALETVRHGTENRGSRGSLIRTADLGVPRMREATGVKSIPAAGATETRHAVLPCPSDLVAQKTRATERLTNRRE